MAGKVQAFEYFGIKLRNDRWSWSGRTADGKTVAIQLWKDHFDYKTKPISYSDFGDKRLPLWTSRLGNLERIENLKWAAHNCEGQFRVVIGTPVDDNVDSRQTSDAYPQKRMVMKIVDFNETTGELRAEMVEN